MNLQAVYDLNVAMISSADKITRDVQPLKAAHGLPHQQRLFLPVPAHELRRREVAEQGCRFVGKRHRERT